MALPGNSPDNSGDPAAESGATPNTRPERVPGALAGQIHIAADFDSLPSDIASAFAADDPD